VAVAGPDDDRPCPPCGSCRQILHELGPEMDVVTAAAGGGVEVVPLRDLLPRAFGRPELGRGGG
jgi:cytidine deaminase